jgi:alanyl-tRNA synthetase
LDVTCFYPTSGGQPHDLGTLDGVAVCDVIETDAGVAHVLEEPLLNDRVQGVIDWERRYGYMRLHSGEHLLTGLFEAAGSGPKVFSSFTQLDFKPSPLDQETLEDVRRRFDEVVDMDVPVRIYYADRDRLDVGDDERKQSFLEKIPADVERLRMVEIGDHAHTFCMGTHVKRTGEIERLKSLRLEPKKKRRKIVYFEL